MDMTSDTQKYPSNWEADIVLKDGAELHIRPIGPADGEALQQFHTGQSERSQYLRFFGPKDRLTQRDIERFTHVDNVDRVGLIALDGERIVGVGRFDRIDDESAEAAFHVADPFQGRGLGTILLERLIEVAKERNIIRFKAEVLPGNPAMMALFNKIGKNLTRRMEDGMIMVEFGW